MTAVLRRLSGDVDWTKCVMSETHVAVCSADTSIKICNYKTSNEIREFETPLGCDTFTVGINILTWSCFNSVNVVDLRTEVSNKYCCCTRSPVVKMSIDNHLNIIIITEDEILTWNPFTNSDSQPTHASDYSVETGMSVGSCMSLSSAVVDGENENLFLNAGRQALLPQEIDDSRPGLQVDPLMVYSQLLYSLTWIAVFSSKDDCESGMLMLRSIPLCESWEVPCLHYCLGTLPSGEDIVVIINEQYCLEVHNLPDSPGSEQPNNVPERLLNLTDYCPGDEAASGCLISLHEANVYLLFSKCGKLIIIDITSKPVVKVDLNMFKPENGQLVVAMHAKTLITSSGVVVVSDVVTSRDIDPSSEEFWELKNAVRSNTQGHNEMYVKDRIMKGKLPITFQLVAAKAIESSQLKNNLENYKNTLLEPARNRFSFHGTNPKNIQSIIQKGLLPYGHVLSSAKCQVDEGYFGSTEKGIYVSRYMDYALQYSNNVKGLSPGDVVDILMLTTVLGRPRHLSEALGPIDPTALYNSHISPNGLEWYLFSECQSHPHRLLTVKAVDDERTAANDF